MTATTNQQEQELEKTAKSVAAPCALPCQPQGQETRDAAVPAIPLGARVRFARRILRDDRVAGRGHMWRVLPDTPGDGVFMGYRYKQNGAWENEADYESYSANYVWCESARVKVALIVTDPWANPQTVDPDGLQIIAPEVQQ